MEYMTCTEMLMSLDQAMIMNVEQIVQKRKENLNTSRQVNEDTEDEYRTRQFLQSLNLENFQMSSNTFPKFGTFVHLAGTHSMILLLTDQLVWVILSNIH